MNKQNKPITVVFCLPGKNFSNNFLMSWTELLMTCIKNNINPLVSCAYDSNVNFVRSKCLGYDVLKGKNQKPFNGELDYDYIMWIDSDMVFKPEHFFKLIKLNVDVANGMYLMDTGRYWCCVKDMNDEYFKKNGNYQFLKKEEVNKNDLPFIADYVGLGWCLMKKGVMEKIEYPPFLPEVYNFDNGIKEFTSEDVALFIKLKKKNIKVVVVPSIIIGHEKTIIYQ
jgi:hypothetical protein